MSEVTPDLFKPVHVDREIEEITRPSLSYWQDAWIRLKANRRALASLYVVIGMILFATVGPTIWRVSFKDQDLEQTSTPPWADRTIRIVEDYQTWTDVPPFTDFGSADYATNIRQIGDANAEYVRLIWQPVAEAAGYRVYRNIVDPREGGPPGLPLVTLLKASTHAYEDRIDLRARTYYYSIVTLDKDLKELEDFETVPVSVRPTTTLASAIESGWVEETTDLKPGDTIELPWHPLGTDYLGRDLLARLMKGAQISLFIGIVAPLLFIVVGIFYGSVAGFLGGNADHLLMRFADFVVALPFLLFMILFKLVFGIESGESGIFALLLALVLLSWPASARLVRGQILQIREEGYISASRLLGTKTQWLIIRHMIPNTMGVILVSFTFAVPSAIFTEAFLSFIGMGVEPPTPSWGSMCNDGTKTMETTPHELIFPALFISITVLAFNILGDGLRDALDARMRSTE